VRIELAGTRVTLRSPRTPQRWEGTEDQRNAPIQFSNSSRSFAISPRDPREFCQNLPLSETEGAGNAGRAMRPQPCVQK
jgi:hypothetical protein